MNQLSFSSRLELARQLIAYGPSDVAGHLQDQMEAAARDAHRVVDNAGAVLRCIQPGRRWHRRDEIEAGSEQNAYLAAAVLGCLPRCCPHLRKGGPQPAFARLPLERLDCGRCVRTFRVPPASDNDRCDVCHRRGVLTFVAFAVASGPVLVTGDACPACATVLRINKAEAAA